MNDLESLLVLNAIESLGSVRIRLLIEEFGGPAKILSRPKTSLTKVKGIGEKIADNIVNWEQALDLEKETSLIQSRKVSVLTLFDDKYPQMLKEIYDPPIVLYVKGTIVDDDKYSIGIVGSRWASFYGQESATRLSTDLALRGFTIVSGLARGIDSCAHRGAIKAGGRTIAVLGNGLDNVYPPENKDLAEEVALHGAVISEFPMGTIPDKRNFPRRNRVISGLSMGIVVVEAARRSGALITANHALEQNRTVFGIPGRIDAFSSSGSNDLIKQGAKVVTGADDIIEEFECVLPEEKKVWKKSAAQRPPPAALTDKEKAIYEFLSEEETGIDDLIEKSGLSSGEVGGVLLSLELKRVIKQLPGKQFTRV